MQPNDIVNNGASTSTIRGRGIQPAPNAVGANTSTDGPHSTPRYYRVLSETETYYRRFQTNGVRIQIRFNDPGDNDDLVRWIDLCLEDLVTNIRRNMDDNDKVGLGFVNHNRPDKPFYISPRFAGLLDKDVILARMHKVLQSYQKIFLNDMLSIAITHIKTPHGGHRNINNKPFSDYLISHCFSIVNIDRNDNLCLAYAIIAGKVFNECIGDKQRFRRFRQCLNVGDYRWLNRVYNDFWVPLNVDVRNGATLDHVKMAQEALKDRFRIHVFLDRNGRDLAFTPMVNTDENIIDIHLLLEENHFVFIKPNALKTVFGYKFLLQPL
jgi:hypothetical protein